MSLALWFRVHAGSNIGGLSRRLRVRLKTGRELAIITQRPHHFVASFIRA